VVEIVAKIKKDRRMENIFNEVIIQQKILKAIAVDRFWTDVKDQIDKSEYLPVTVKNLLATLNQNDPNVIAQIAAIAEYARLVEEKGSNKTT